jgi:hypothetical protein
MTERQGRPYHGPCTVLSPTEATRVLDALYGHRDATALAIAEKCRATLSADPKFRRPTR